MTRITAAEMARAAGIDYERFRETLAKCEFDWHGFNELWQAETGTRAHRDMQRVLDRLLDQDDRFEPSGTGAADGERAAWDGYACAAISGLMARHANEPQRAAALAARQADASMSERPRTGSGAGRSRGGA